jgi:hypothetical protein
MPINPARARRPIPDGYALGADDLQWILYRASGTKRCRTPMDAWKGVSFVRSAKSILLRCVREKALEVSPTGWAYLSALPDTFAEWKLAQAKSPTEVRPAEPVGRAEDAMEGVGGGPVSPKASEPLPASLMGSRAGGA